MNKIKIFLKQKNMGNKRKGKKRRTTPRKENEKFMLAGPFDSLEDDKNERDYHHETANETDPATIEATNRIQDLKESMKDIESQMDNEKAEKVEKLFKDGTASYDAANGAKLLEKDAEGHHYHMNNPYTHRDGFEKNDIFDSNGKIKRNSALFMTCYNCLEDFGDVQVASHDKHENKYSIYVKNPNR